MTSTMLKKIISVSVSAILLSTLTLMLLGYLNPYVFWIVAGVSALIAFIIIPKLLD
ncbi:MAG: hypothetical protein V5A68_06650 [Candidatus Thermoplasmatota archaeon]